MYCWGENRVKWVQYGCWPGNAACDDCRKIWDAHCDRLVSCQRDRAWMDFEEAAWIARIVREAEYQDVN